MNQLHIIKKSNFNRHLSRLFFFLLLVLLSLWSHSVSRSQSVTAFVDPSLFGVSEGIHSVIVTGINTETAVSAINAVGGQITSDLWLINAAAATLSNNQLTRLSSFPGILTIINNYTVTPAGSDNNDDSNDDGYVTNRRIKKGQYTHSDLQRAPFATMPDGGFVTVDEKGGMILINADGSERVRTNLISGSPYYTAPQVAATGIIYLAGEGKRVFAVNPNGSIRWKFQDAGESFKGGVLLSPDESIVYVTDQKRKVYAIDADTGKKLWHLNINQVEGDIKATPAIAPDGTLYVVSEKGYLAAVDASGVVQWTYRASGGGTYKLPPLISNDGRIFITGEDKLVSAIKSIGGKLSFKFQTNSPIKAQPVVGSDGTLFVAAEDRMLYAVNMDGTVRFTFRPPTGRFKTSPVLTANGDTVLVAVEENKLYAVNTQTGVQQWQHMTLGKILSAPVIGPNDIIVLGSEGMDVRFLTSEGMLVYQTAVSGSITQSPLVDLSGNIIIQAGEKEVFMLGMLPNHWDGRPDVLPTDSKKVWQLVNPVAIDIGADQLHDGFSGQGAITGEGITIAVVDTGVYFSHEVKVELGASVAKSFVGQADFINATCATVQINQKKWETIGIQYDDHCFTDQLVSKDDYGHGSHVAGIIWNNFTDYNTGVTMGVSPNAQILSVRVLGPNGTGTYEDVIRGIQYVVAQKDTFDIRVLNLSLSATASVPYFVDPINRAVEAAWAEGIVVVAAAGNDGPNAQTITVPGNDPYVITVGALNSNRTPGYWADDEISRWSASGPTLDGFIKPDVLAPGSNIVSFMYNDEGNADNSARLVQAHPDYSATTSLYRMNGTSMSTAVTSGVIALMLEANPDLTPDEVKFRLMYSARTALTADGQLQYSPLQQGVGRIWAPAAVLGKEFPANGVANVGMDIESDLTHGWALLDNDGNLQFDTEGYPILDETEVSYHYQGSVRAVNSDDGQAYIYYIENPTNNTIAILGGVQVNDMAWLDHQTLTNLNLTFNQAGPNDTPWQYAEAWSSGAYAWGGGAYAWGGTNNLAPLTIGANKWIEDDPID